jgi:hypothetical protein
MEIEKLERYKADSFRNIKTGEEIEGYCVPDEDGDYVLYAKVCAWQDMLLEVLKEAIEENSSRGIPRVQILIRRIEESR